MPTRPSPTPAAPRLAAFAVFACLVAVVGPVTATPRGASWSTLGKTTCVDIAPSRVKRVGRHWLLLQVDRVRAKPPTDNRVTALKAHVFDERTAKIQILHIPIAPLRAQLSRAALDGTLDRVSRRGRRSDRFVLDVQHVSDDGSVVALDVRSRARQRGSQRAVMFVNLRTRKVVLGPPVQRRAPGDKQTAVYVGIDATGGHLYVLSRRAQAPGGKATGNKVTAEVQVVRVDEKTGARRTLIRFTTPPRANQRLSLGTHTARSRDGTLFAVTEYQESPKGKAAVYVIDLKTGTKLSLPAPATAYGVAFSPDNQRLVVGSNRMGTVTLWDLHKRKRLHTARGLKRLHKVFFSTDGKLVWVARKAGPLVGLDAVTLKRKKTRTAAAVFGRKAKGVLYAQLAARPGGLRQTVAMTADRFGFGDLSRLCAFGR